MDTGITKGGKYKIRDVKGNEFSGTFTGYTMIGSETAMTIDTGKETLYVPIIKILCVTLLEQAEEETVEKKTKTDVYYG